MINELSYTVVGRPAPQGSKKRGAAGQMLEQSPYLPAWRQAVKRATYQTYVRLGIPTDALPVLRGRIEIGLRFRMPEGVPVDGPPDLDKMQRAVWDAMTHARVWEDDARVVRVLWAEKLASGPTTGEPGCDIYVRTERPAGVAAGGAPVYGGPEAMADAAARAAGCCGLAGFGMRDYCEPCPARPAIVARPAGCPRPDCAELCDGGCIVQQANGDGCPACGRLHFPWCAPHGGTGYAASTPIHATDCAVWGDENMIGPCTCGADA